jgi:hypothetical protein
VVVRRQLKRRPGHNVFPEAAAMSDRH